MNHVRDPAARQHLEAALEATCDALSVLQVIDARAEDEGWIKPCAAQAIDSLRHAVAELRAARGTEASPLALGFVAAPAAPKESAGSPAHSSPRRTA